MRRGRLIRHPEGFGEALAGPQGAHRGGRGKGADRHRGGNHTRRGSGVSRPAPSHRQAHLQHPFPPERSSGRPGPTGTREIYRFLERMGILPTIPPRQTWQNLREKRLKAGFRYDAERDVYICPGGENPLPYQGAVQRCGGLQGPPPGVQRVPLPGHDMPGQAVFHHEARVDNNK